jgi:DNA-directed RNA polymerase beta' subunit
MLLRQIPRHPLQGHHLREVRRRNHPRIVRRERMGHVDLAVPVAHVWFLRAIPSRLSLVLGISAGDLEKVVYFAGYIVNAGPQERKEAHHLGELETEYKSKTQESPGRQEQGEDEGALP